MKNTGTLRVTARGELNPPEHSLHTEMVDQYAETLASAAGRRA